MTYEEKAIKIAQSLTGKRIKAVYVPPKEETRGESIARGWIIELEDGRQIQALADEEGNDSGCFVVNSVIGQGEDQYVTDWFILCPMP